MSETHYRRDLISLLDLSITRVWVPWWGIDAHHYTLPWSSYTVWLGLGRLRLVLRLRLPWRKP